jgi:23S rRNA pseudouridine1911/1915/1917 synthase
MEIQVLTNTEHFCVINKPAELLVHADGRTQRPTVVDWIQQQFPQIQENAVGEPMDKDDGTTIPRPGIVHRLDKATSGALIIAKDTPTYKFFKRQFRQRRVAKRYCAFVYGKMTKERGVIDRPIGRSKKDFRRRSAGKHARGKKRKARTVYKPIHAETQVTYLDAFPKTGRQHQIRVHLRSVHHPIVCDRLYAKDKDCILGFERLALHARELRFFAPGSKREQLITVAAPLPDDFCNALKELDISAEEIEN